MAPGFVCTAFAHSLYVSAQKSVRAQTAGIVSSMKTVCGIVYALLFLGEIPSMRELAGKAVILSVAMYSSLNPIEKFSDNSLLKCCHIFVLKYPIEKFSDKQSSQKWSMEYN